MTTQAELITWLKTPDHIRTVLVVVEGVLGSPPSSTFYLSNRPYTTTDTDTPSNKYFDPCIIGGINFTESLDLRGASSSISYGDIEIDNTNGVRDSWLSYIWANKEITIYIGDPRWSYADYYPIFNGIVSDLISRDRNTLNIILVDKSQKLNNPISEATFVPFGIGQTEETTPQVFGECFNISPPQINSAKLEYVVHTGPIEQIIEVRDNGLPVEFWAPGETFNDGTGNYTVGSGKFALKQSPYGQITCSVQGHKNTTYYNSVPSLIKEILTNVVPVNIRLTGSDIDDTNFSGFTSAPVGIYLTSTDNAWDVCNQLASSIGAQLVFDTLGVLKLVPLDTTGNNNTPFIINQEDIEQFSLNIAEKLVVEGATKIAYCRNWTVQDSGLAGGVPSEHVQLFDTEWLFKLESTPQVISDYSLVDNNDYIETLLITATGAESEAQRRHSLFSGEHYIYNMVGYPHLLPLNIGDNVTLTHPRYNLETGANGVVVSISRDWLQGRVNIGVLV